MLVCSLRWGNRDAISSEIDELWSMAVAKFEVNWLIMHASLGFGGVSRNTDRRREARALGYQVMDHANGVSLWVPSFTSAVEPPADGPPHPVRRMTRTIIAPA